MRSTPPRSCTPAHAWRSDPIGGGPSIQTRRAARITVLGLWLLLAAACDPVGPDPVDPGIVPTVEVLSSMEPAGGWMAVSADAGAFSPCAVGADHTVQCWGGTPELAANAPSGPNFVDVSVYSQVACGLTTGRTIDCWGTALGETSSIVTGEPSYDDFISVEVTSSFACGIQDGGGHNCWGVHPRFHSGAWLLAELAVGIRHSCGVRVDGTMACWGEDTFGQSSPPTLDAGKTWRSVTVGEAHSCGIDSDNLLTCWGADARGQVSGVENEPFSTTHTHPGTYAAVGAGKEHTCAIRTDGSLSCWGSSYVANPPSGSQWSLVSSGNQHSCAIDAGGDLLCWGAHYIYTPTATFVVPPTATPGTPFAVSFEDVAVPPYLPGDPSLHYRVRCPDGTVFEQESPGVECPGLESGEYLVRGRVLESVSGASLQVEGTVVVAEPANRAPEASAGGPYSGSEGAAVALELSGSDADGDVLTYRWDLGDGTTGSGPTPPSQHTYVQNGPYVITLGAFDGVAWSQDATAEAAIANVAPSIEPLIAPADPVPVGAPVSVSASFSDPGILDTHQARISWGDGRMDGPIAATSPVSFDHEYDAPGIYTVSITITDDDGALTTRDHQFVVVYDPAGGFVTGGGWIHSPTGAYLADPELSGKGSFGFVGKYRKGATVPDGSTQFRFQAGDLAFHSIAYDWLVISGARARLKGVGQINGSGSFGFLLVATDSDVDGGGDADRFRIRIWEIDSEIVIYDNDPAGDGTGLGGGSITVHSPKR